MEPASIIRKWGLPVALLCGLVGFFATGLHDLVSWQTVTLHYAGVNHFTQQSWLASYAGFAVLYITVVAFSLPIASLLTLAAGALIGWPAIGLIVLAATTGASLVFIAARGLFRNLLRARAGAFFASVESGFTNNAFSFLLFLRLMPVAPFWAVNILPAFTRMTLPQFIGATAIGIIPGTSVYVAVGRGFDHVLARGETPDLAALGAPQIWLPLAGLAVLALMPIFYRHFTSTRSKDQSNDPS
jgi:uncharacterized membrane protein YdjX (TVP38/TMEM64 family)